MPIPNDYPFEPDAWEFTEADEALLYGENEENEEDYWLGEKDLTRVIQCVGFNF